MLDHCVDSSVKLTASQLGESTVKLGARKSTSCVHTDPMSSKSEKEEEKSSPATVPLSLESFTFHHSLGDGGFGKVLLATDNIRKERVAVKVVDKTDFTEFGISLVERDILQLSHKSPYLIHGLAAFHTMGFVYYVMEVATRGCLSDFLIQHFPLDIATIKFIAAELVCGTEFLHRIGILHRDLKPDNILLTQDGHIKITDFGLSVKGVFHMTTEECHGTTGYAAPEMVKDLAHGRGVDFFAIGVILYILFTLEFPFPGEFPEDMNYSILHHTPEYPESLTPETVDLIQGLLQEDQSQRLGVIGNIKEHPFFSDINWEDVEARRMVPPAIMTADSVGLNVDETLDYEEDLNIIASEDQNMFHQFSFVCPEWSQHYHSTDSWTTNRLTTRPFDEE